MLILDKREREELWQRVVRAVENYASDVSTARVAPELDVTIVRQQLEAFNFESPLDSFAAIDMAVQNLWQHQVHTPHPRYFGLFNPAPTTMGIFADALVAAFNPQLAAWSHSPFAAEVERHLVRAFGERFGYDAAQTDGTFCSGGAEANHTALLTALVHHFPQYAKEGLRHLDQQPTLYVSTQSHHSMLKAARFCGLGTDAVRAVPADENYRLSVAALADQIAEDRQAGYAPFMIVATAGTTNAGIVEPISEVADVAVDERLWFHVDAAWGGAAALVPELRSLLAGVERADSITFDAHKWLSVPMGAGLYLTRHTDILSRTCRIVTDYMPRDAAEMDVVDPHLHSMQWSRRFTGLKVFLSLAVAGWEGYETALRHQTKMGELLRRELETANWRVVNKTALPVVCFVDQAHPQGASASYLDAIAREVVASGQAWLSTTRLDKDTPVLRACVTNYRTEAEDVRALVEALNQARRRC